MESLYDGFDTNNTSISTSFNMNMNESNRPISTMTSNKSAGYTSHHSHNSHKSESERKKHLNIFSENKEDPNDDDIQHRIQKTELMERNVNKLLRKSIFYSHCGDYNNALDLAIKCREKEKEIILFCEKYQLSENVNSDLTFSVLFNLGYIYELKEMYSEALNVYNNGIITNTDFDRINKSKIRLNIGNIHYKQDKYELAIKMYRMCLDEIGDINSKLKINIIRNIGNSFIKLGQFIEAIQSFESMSDLSDTDTQSLFNLLILYYVLGDREKMRKTFSQLCALDCPNPSLIQVIQLCNLRYLGSNEAIISKIQILSNTNKYFGNDNNLAFISFLSAQYLESSKYALSAIVNDRYNALSLVNRANCLYVFNDFESAKEMYLEAIGVEADCTEAIYNLGLICKKMGNYNDALQAFKKLNKTINSRIVCAPQIIYQISDLYELLQQYELSIKWYKVLHSIIPNDSNVLIKLANLHKIYLKNENIIFQNYFDAHALFKCEIDILSWLGIYYINHSLFENAINIFKNAYIIQPNQIKWKFMIASCFRRMRNFQKSIDIYLQIFNTEKDVNILQKCLQYLCTIMEQVSHPKLNEYQIKLQQIQLQHHTESSNNQDSEDNRESDETKPQIEEDDNNWDNIHLDELLPS